MPHPAAPSRLWDAFAAECAAYMKYVFFAQAARKEGYEQIADIFDTTAANEKAHAFLWLTALGALRDGTDPGDTLKNLQAAAEGEREEWTVLYKECAAAANQDGDAALKKRFEDAAAIEAFHEKGFRRLIEQMQNGEIFSRPDQPDALWRCRFCGHIHAGSQAPTACPVCGKPQAFYQPYTAQ